MKTLVALSLTGLLALSACSSSGDDTAPSATPSASEPSAGMIGPIMVKPSQTEVEATVGRTIVFDVGDNPGQWDISTDKPDILKVTKGGERDGAVFNPGAEALAAGEATVTLEDPEAMDALVFTVTVTD